MLELLERNNSARGLEGAPCWHAHAGVPAGLPLHCPAAQPDSPQLQPLLTCKMRRHAYNMRPAQPILPPRRKPLRKACRCASPLPHAAALRRALLRPCRVLLRRRQAQQLQARADVPGCQAVAPPLQQLAQPHRMVGLLLGVQRTVGCKQLEAAGKVVGRVGWRGRAETSAEAGLQCPSTRHTLPHLPKRRPPDLR